MTIDFRVAVDWQDNGHVNWLQNYAAESDPLNLLTSATVGFWTIANGTINSTSVARTNYGLDWAQATSPGTLTMSIGVASSIGQIGVDSSSTYTVALWIRKTDLTDNAKNLRIIVRETTASSSTILQQTFGAVRTDAASSTVYYKHSVTFTTTASTERIYIVTSSTSGAFTGTYVCTGLMLVSGSTVPSTFNDNKIKVLTHRVAGARWNIGYKTSIVGGSVANENRLECSLYNLDDYITETKYQDVHRIYIEGSDDGGSTWTRLYTGWTRKWMPIFDPNSDQHLKFTAVSSRFYLDGIKARVAVQETQSPADIIIALAEAAQLPDGTTVTAFRPGNTSYTISYAGQNWTEGVDLLRAISDVAWGDGVLDYFARDDRLLKFTFTDLLNTSASSDFTITNWLRNTADFRYGDPWLNMVEMRVSPRKLSATSTARLWELPASVTVANGASDTILARFNDEDKPYQISARQVNIASQTWSAGTPTVTLNAKSTSAYIEITNSTGSSTTLTAMRINGQKIKTWDSFYEQLQYDTEITSDGNNTLTIPSELPDSVSRAQTIMQNWLDLYGTKHHRLWSVVVPGDRGSDSDLIDYSIGDVCSIDYPDGNTYKHVVIGEEWAWRKGGQYEKKLYLERIYSNGLTPIKPSP